MLSLSQQKDAILRAYHTLYENKSEEAPAFFAYVEAIIEDPFYEPSEAVVQKALLINESNKKEEDEL